MEWFIFYHPLFIPVILLSHFVTNVCKVYEEFTVISRGVAAIGQLQSKP
jgi:hypothetical protein